MKHPFTLPLALALSPLASAQLVELDETEVPGTLPLIPGAMITGGLSAEAQEDIFAFHHPGQTGLVEFTLTYDHSSEVADGKSHLQAEVFLSAFGTRLSFGTLTTETLESDARNTLKFTIPSADVPIPKFITPPIEISISSADGINSSYQLEAQLILAPDHYDSTSSNNSRSSASALIPHDPSSTTWSEEELTLHSGSDTDWFRITPGKSGDYRVRTIRGNISPGLAELKIDVLDSAGTLLAQSALLTDSQEVQETTFTASAGTSYLIRASMEAPDFSGYRMAIGKIDLTEPDPSVVLRDLGPFHTLSTGALPEGGITLDDLTIECLGANNLADYDKLFLDSLPAGDYVVSVTSENLDAPSLGYDSVSHRIPGGLRYQFTKPTTGPHALIVSASSERQLGSYQFHIRPYSDFDAWRDDQGLPLANEFDDLNGDGLPLGIVRALKLDPLAFHDAPLQLEVSSSGRQLEFNLPATGTAADLLIEQSQNMGDWSAVPNEAINQPSAIIPAGSVGTVIIDYPASDTQRFFRVSLP